MSEDFTDIEFLDGPMKGQLVGIRCNEFGIPTDHRITIKYQKVHTNSKGVELSREVSAMYLRKLRTVKTEHCLPWAYVFQGEQG